MTNKDTFEAYMQFAQFVTERADKRRQFAWKLTFGIWALLIAAIFYISAAKFPLWVGLVIIGLYGSWLQASLGRTVNDTKLAWMALDKANQKMNLGFDLKNPPHLEAWIRSEWYQNHLAFLTSWSLRLQFWFTVGLLIIFYLTKVTDITWIELSLSVSDGSRVH